MITLRAQKHPDGGLLLVAPDGTRHRCEDASRLWSLVSELAPEPPKALGGSVWEARSRKKRTPSSTSEHRRERAVAEEAALHVIGEALLDECHPIVRKAAPKIAAPVGRFLRKISR